MPTIASNMGRGHDHDHASRLCRDRVDTAEGLHGCRPSRLEGGYPDTLDRRVIDALGAMRRVCEGRGPS
jgi:hypothetical protein